MSEYPISLDIATQVLCTCSSKDNWSFEAEQPFHRNFFLDKTLSTTLFPDKLLPQGFIRNFFRHKNHGTCLVGGLSGISGQTSTRCLHYTLVSRQSIVRSFSPALEAEHALDFVSTAEHEVAIQKDSANISPDETSCKNHLTHTNHISPNVPRICEILPAI